MITLFPQNPLMIVMEFRFCAIYVVPTKRDKQNCDASLISDVCIAIWHLFQTIYNVTAKTDGSTISFLSCECQIFFLISIIRDATYLLNKMAGICFLWKNLWFLSGNRRIKLREIKSRLLLNNHEIKCLFSSSNR